MATNKVENNELIAVRVPVGDCWKLVDDPKNTVHKSLTDVLEAWFTKNGEKAEFRLSPLDSKIYVIRNEKKVIPTEPIKKYNIYGDEMDKLNSY